MCSRSKRKAKRQEKIQSSIQSSPIELSREKRFGVFAQGVSVAALSLMGTGSLSFAADAPVSANQTVLPQVVVTGKKDVSQGTYKADTVSISKYTQSLVNTPQSISVVNKQVLEDQNATTLQAAVRNVAGISLAAGEGGFQGDNLTVRGFSSRNDIFLDGMRDFGSYYRDSFNYESVEVLRGPSSIAFGRGSTGGAVNQVSKTPDMDSLVSGEIMVGTADKQRVSADINQPIGNGMALRVNVMEESGNVDGRNVLTNNKVGFAPSLAFGLGSPTRLTVSYLHESYHGIPGYGIPWFFDEPANVDRHNFYGFKDDYLKTQANVATVKLEHDFSDDVTLRDQLRYGEYRRQFRGIYPHNRDGGPVWTESSALDTLYVERHVVSNHSEETFFQNQLDLISQFDWGSSSHTLVSGVEIGREVSEPTRFDGENVPSANLANPDEDNNFTGDIVTNRTSRGAIDTFALYLSDSIQLSPQWEMLAGVRWDHLKSTYRRESGGGVTSYSRTDSVLSWRGGLVFKPVELGSVYYQYSTSFDPSAAGMSLNDSSEKLGPEENITHELGSKWVVMDDRLSVRGALFETRKLNAQDGNSSTGYTLSGDQSVRGVELEITGQLTDNWDLTAGYAHMTSRVDDSAANPEFEGNPLANVPENTFTFWSTYRLPGNFTVGAGGSYVGERWASTTSPYADNGKPKILPEYWVFNAMLAYKLTENWDLQLNVYNLADTVYYDQGHSHHIIPGDGRSASLSAKFKF